MEKDRIPFSVCGSYFVVSLVGGGLAIRNISGDAPTKEVLLVELLRAGAALPFVPEHGDGLLRLVADGAVVELCFEDLDSLRLRGEGCQLRLRTAEGVVYGCGGHITPQRWLFANYGCRVNVVLEALRGTMEVADTWDGANSTGFAAVFGAAEGPFEAAMELYRGPSRAQREHGMPFEDCAARWQRSFAEYLAKTVAVPAPYEEARRWAAYLNWSSIVAPEGLMGRRGMYMSKNWMTNIWSWDHCFNAMALAYANPELAWEQIMVMFDRQDPSGALPDSFNNSAEVWMFCKPPIHGWAIRWMFAHNPAFGIEHIRQIYQPLCRWTDWWFRERDFDRDGMPQYHHGNDSGWDNSTVFAQGVPVESPDLGAFLILQMDVLADFAGQLGLVEEAAQWQARSDRLLGLFAEHFVLPDGRLTARLSGSHRTVENQSLLPYLALVLGPRLPDAVRRQAVEHLRQSGLITPYGLATEAPQSPCYQPDGYWRGPIWAPSSMLMIDGLAACGETELARTLARAFADLCASQGFAENFDALTGHWLRDPAYTWTSSVFLMLAHEYLG